MTPPNMFFCFFLNHIKQHVKNIIPQTVAIGVANPTYVSDEPGSLDMKRETGIRMHRADMIP